MEKALQIVAIYLKSKPNYEVLDTEEVIKTILQKCALAGKVGIKQHSQEIMFLLMEQGRKEVLIRQLVQGMQNKNPKVSPFFAY